MIYYVCNPCQDCHGKGKHCTSCDNLGTEEFHEVYKCEQDAHQFNPDALCIELMESN